MDTPRDNRDAEDEAHVDDSEHSVIDEAGVNNAGEGDELEETE